MIIFLISKIFNQLNLSKIKFLTIFLIANSLFLTSSKAINIDDAINIAQANNRNIKLEQIRHKNIKIEKVKAITEFLPNISASAEYAERNSFYEGQTYDRSTKQRTREIKVEQPIFDGLHSVSKYREADYKVKSSGSKISDKIQEISFLAVQSYCNLFRYQELIAISKDNKKLSSDFLKLLNRRKEVRIIDNADIIKFNYEASIVEEKYLDSVNRFNKAKYEYKNIIGEIHDNLLQPKLPAEKLINEKMLEQALLNNHNIKSYRFSYLASKASLNAEKSNFLPKVSVSASASKQDRVVYLNNKDLNSRSVALNVSIPIFQKGLEYANVIKASHDRDLAKEEYEIIRESIIKEFSAAVEEYNFVLELNKTNKKLFEMAKNRAEIFNKRSKLKTEDPIEVIRAKIEFNDRKTNYINSQMDLIIAHYKIKYFLGEI